MELATSRGGSLALLLLALALTFAAAAIGGLGTAGSTGPGSWYEGLDKAPWNPPSWLFGVVWTPLYVLIAVAAWLVAREGLDRRDVQVALALWLAQLALNALWPILFFDRQLPGLALVEIVVLLGLVVATALAFRPVSVTAALLLVPYAVWIAFAATLNAWVAWRN